MQKTLLGIVVLAAVLAGVFWARGGRHHPPSGAAGHGTSAAPAAVPADDSSLPDVTIADAAVQQGDLRITLSVSPRPPVAFQPKRFRVRVERGGAPVALAGGRISFEMRMPMGDHRYTLVAGEDGWQQAEVVLPFCKSGNPRWYAIVDGTVDGAPVSARFRLDLAKPGAGS